MLLPPMSVGVTHTTIYLGCQTNLRLGLDMSDTGVEQAVVAAEGILCAPECNSRPHPHSSHPQIPGPSRSPKLNDTESGP